MLVSNTTTPSELCISEADKELTFNNLITLKDYLIKCREGLTLVMNNFGGIYHLPLSDFKPNKDGTHEVPRPCCLLGLAPEVLKVSVKEHFVRELFCYYRFCEYHFPYLCTGYSWNSLGRYVFGGGWTNSVDHAIRRIQDLVDEVATVDNMSTSKIERAMVLSREEEIRYGNMVLDLPKTNTYEYGNRVYTETFSRCCIPNVTISCQ